MVPAGSKNVSKSTLANASKEGYENGRAGIYPPTPASCPRRPPRPNTPSQNKREPYAGASGINSHIINKIKKL